LLIKLRLPSGVI